MTSPIELLQAQQRAELERLQQDQARKLEAITPLVSTRDELAAALAVVDDLRARYAKQWKQVTGGRSPVVSESDLLAAELERPVPVRRRAHHAKSKSKQSGVVEQGQPAEPVPADIG